MTTWCFGSAWIVAGVRRTGRFCEKAELVQAVNVSAVGVGVLWIEDDGCVVKSQKSNLRGGTNLWVFPPFKEFE